jgi:hypothetical protein
MALTGGWASKTRVKSLTGHKIRTVEPSHSVVSVENARTEASFTAPPGADWGEPGVDPWAVFVTDTPGVWTDSLPANDPTGHSYNPGHATDTGTDPNRKYRGNVFGRFTDDNFVDHDQDQPPPPILRGTNSRPENNPTEPPRPGRRIGRTWLDRARNVGQRRTDYRVTYANLPLMGGDPSTVTVPDQPGPYSLPFNVWARPLNGPDRRPMQRRVPTSLSDLIMTDGGEDTDDMNAIPDAGVSSDWVIG